MLKKLHKNRRRVFWLSGLSGLLFFLAFPGCGPTGFEAEKADEVVSGCEVDEDQAATFSGKWNVNLPLPVALFSSDADPAIFTVGEAEAISKSAAIWNQHLESIGAKKPIELLDESGNFRVSAEPLAPNPCSTGLIQNGNFVKPVVVYKRLQWPYTDKQDVIAFTTFCSEAGEEFDSLRMAAMEVNYQDYFGEAARKPDLQSVFAHEFGHLLGLNHSCEFGDQGPGKPNCQSTKSEYIQALMFPAILFPDGVNGEVRNALKRNDKGRINCLYR